MLLATSTRPPPLHPGLEARYVTARGLSLRYVRAGHGSTLLLIHGYGESLVAWRGVFDRLRHDHDVIAIDLPGFGLSAKPASGYQADSLGATVVAALDALGVGEAVLVGHSLGGGVAVAAALSAPHRVLAMVLLDPAVIGTPLVVPDTARADATREALRSAIAEYEALRTHFTSPHDPAWLRESDPAASYLPAQDTSYRKALASVLREFDFGYLDSQRARQLSLPVLVLWGEYDPVLPLEGGRALARSLPRARFSIIARSLHRPHVERPAETADSIASFVDTLGRAGGAKTPRP